MFYPLLLGSALATADLALPKHADAILYRIDSPGAPASYDRYLVLEDLNKFAHYFGENPGPDAMTSTSLRDYSRSVSDDAITLGFNGIGLPFEISHDKRWDAGGSSCQAFETGRKTNDFLIVCSQRDSIHTTTSVFKYQIGRGVTGFFAPCFKEKTCWYTLE